MIFRSFLQAGFECAAIVWPRGPLKGRRQDMHEGTGHIGAAVRGHYERCKALGIQTFRSGIPWHKVLLPGRWEEGPVHRAFQTAAEADVEVIWDLIHFGFPAGVSPFDPFFPELLAEFGRRVARIAKEYGQPLWLCPVNEPSITAHFCGHNGQWGPGVRGKGYELKRKLARAQIETIKAVRHVDPDTRFLYCDPFEGGRWQFEALDILSGKVSPLLGGSLEFVDVVGVNHYPHFRGPSIADCLVAVAERYSRPVVMSETSLHIGHPHHGGYPDKAAWLHYCLDQMALAERRGVTVKGLCWYPVIDSPAWNGRRGEFWPHGLFRPDGSLDEDLAKALRSCTPARSLAA